MNTRTIRGIVKDCRDGTEGDPSRNRPGAGRPRKLEADNRGLVAAAMALNTGHSLRMATTLCNVKDEEAGITVSKDTVLRSLEAYTSVDDFE